MEDTATFLGAVRIPDGAAVGHVLTSDGSGYATWQQGGGGGADADWIIAGNDMHAGVPGKVGIGVDAPSAKLEIESAVGRAAYVKTHDASSTALSVRNLGVGSTAGMGDEDYGVYGQSGGLGVYGTADSLGVLGVNYNGRFGYLGGGYAVYGEKPNDNFGYIGGSSGVRGEDLSSGNSGSLGNDEFGVQGYASAAVGVRGLSGGGAGVFGRSDTGTAVEGWNTVGDTRGKLGTNLFGAYGEHDDGSYGYLGGDGKGVFGYSPAGDAVYGSSPSGLAGRFVGDVEVQDGEITAPTVVITGGADLSEGFRVSAAPSGRTPSPGLLVRLDDEAPGALVVCDEAYDRRVAGVISGAGDVSPGLLMGQEGSAADGDLPVALSGRVWCRADAGHGPIAVGDLLTSSPTPGHAMRAADPARAHGAVVGKAMTPLDKGRGLVLVLVNLQ
jgi:hypothetical protein